MLSYEYRKNEVEIRQLKKKWDQEKDEDESELLWIEIERRTFIARNHERIARDRIREIREWHEIKEDLKGGWSTASPIATSSAYLLRTRWIRQFQAWGRGSPRAE
jgi:hypothetical protein